LREAYVWNEKANSTKVTQNEAAVYFDVLFNYTIMSVTGQ